MLERFDGRDFGELTTTPPHDVPGEPMRPYLPTGCAEADRLQQMIAVSEATDSAEIACITGPPCT